MFAPLFFSLVSALYKSHLSLHLLPCRSDPVLSYRVSFLAEKCLTTLQRVRCCFRPFDDDFSLLPKPLYFPRWQPQNLQEPQAEAAWSEAMDENEYTHMTTHLYCFPFVVFFFDNDSASFTRRVVPETSLLWSISPEVRDTILYKQTRLIEY